MKLTCKICEDLLPLYVDEMVSEETKQAVEEHVETCEACRSYLQSVQEELPLPNLIEEPSKEQEVIKKLHRRLMLTQVYSLLCGVFIASLLIMNDVIFQNILLLPVLGLITYWVNQKPYKIMVVTSLFLAGIFSLTGALYSIGTASFFSDLLMESLGMLLWAIIFFVLMLIGYLCALLLSGIRKGCKMKKGIQKSRTIAAWIGIGVLCIGILVIYNSFNGNPISAIYARIKMNHYMEITYPENDVVIHDPSYSFKTGGYHSDAYLYTEEESRPFDISYRHGRVYENYYNQYIEDRVQSRRLANEAQEQIKKILVEEGIEFDKLSAELSVAIGKYDNSTYQPQQVVEPITIDIYKYTDEKETIEAFGQWCERIRQALVEEGYPIERITLASDPYMMVARHELRLTGEAFKKPIDKPATYKGYTDYGAINGYNELSKEDFEKERDAWGEKPVPQNQHLQEKVEAAVELLELELTEVDVINEKEASRIFITWVGEQITLDHFMQQAAMIKQSVLEALTEEEQQVVESFHFQYHSGAATHSYFYDWYREDFEKDVETLTLEVLQDPKYNRGW